MAPPKGGWQRTGEILVILLITAVFLEIALQAHYYVANKSFLFRRVYTPIYVKDEVCGYRVKPDLQFRHVTSEFEVTYYTNREGLRSSAAREEYRNNDGKAKVFLVGPSFAFGWGVNYHDTFGHVLEKVLNKAGYGGGRQVEVLNLGVPAMPLPNQFQLLQETSANCHPDLIVQFTFGSLMVGETPHFEVQDGSLVNKDAGFKARVTSLLKNSAIVFYSWIAYTAIDSKLAAQSHAKIIGAGRDLENYGNFDPNRPGVKASLAFYKQLAAFAASQKARLLLVYIPLSYEVHQQDTARWRLRGVTDRARLIAFNQKFADYLTGKGIPCLDLTPDLQKEASSSKRRLYYWLDLHWTPAGNDSAAKAVANYLAANKNRLALTP
jgi:hypothetical protein